MRKVQLYAQVLTSAVEGKNEKEVTEISKRFKGLLKKRGDIRLTSQILRELRDIQEEKEGRRAEVMGAAPLSEDLKKKIQQTLQKKGFSMKERTDSRLIGGTAIVLGNEYIIDGTIRGKMQKLSQLLNE